MANSNDIPFIFLVDDEPIQNEMLKDYISEKFEYKIKTFDSGEDAINNLNLNPEIVILDFHLNSHLPNAQNGVEVLTKIKGLLPQTTVLMLSGQDKLEIAVECMKLGAYDYIIKSETAFSRIENTIKNVQEKNGLKTANNTFKNIIIFCGVIILSIILFTMYLLKHFGKD